MNNLLREFISLTVSEAAVTSRVASEQSLAVYLRPSKVNRQAFSMTLWNPRAVSEKLESLAKIQGILWDDMLEILENNYKDWIIGFIELSKTQGDTTGPAWGAWAVTAAAAEKGYGPFMYDLAMSYCGTIMSDRHSVSKFAEQVWTKYLQRSDVVAKELDDISNPRTPPKDDDAKVYKDRPALNFAYSAKGKLDVAMFVERTQTDVMKIATAIAPLIHEKKHFAEMARDLYNTIYVAADEYFSFRYSAVSGK